MSAVATRPLHAERRGAGEPAVVFLHGLAASGRYWRGVADRLAGEGRQRHLVDLLGFGRSPWPDLAYTVEDHLAALGAWRAAAGLAGTPLVLVGHSLGALLALAWAHRAPLVAGVVPVALPVYRDPAEARRRLARLSLLHRLTLASPPLARAACAVMCQSRPLWRLLVPLVARRFPREVARDGVLHSWRSLSGTLEHCIFGTTFEHVLEQAAGLPARFVHGEADDTAPIAAVRELVATLPAGSLLAVPGAGHDVPLSHPALVAGTIDRFLGRLAADAGGDGSGW